MAKVVLDAEIRLLRIRINKILGLRITKGLKSERHESGRVQVILIQEDRMRKIQCLKNLCIRLIAKSCGNSRVRRHRTGPASRMDRQSLEDRDRIQVSWVPEAAWITATRSASKCQLPARGAIRCVAQEI